MYTLYFSALITFELKLNLSISEQADTRSPFPFGFWSRGPELRCSSFPDAVGPSRAVLPCLAAPVRKAARGRGSSTSAGTYYRLAGRRGTGTHPIRRTPPDVRVRPPAGRAASYARCAYLGRAEWACDLGVAVRPRHLPVSCGRRVALLPPGGAAAVRSARHQLVLPPDGQTLGSAQS